MKATPSFSHRRYHFIDQRGAYKEENPTAPGGRRFQLIDKRTGNKIRLRPNRGWGFDQEEFDRLTEENRISFITDSSVMVKLYLHETDKATPQSVFYQPARSASERLNNLMGANVFDFPKDELVLQRFVEMLTTDKDIVMDFFAGSGTTAHAVLAQNAVDGFARRYILVQLPEPLDANSTEQANAAKFCEQNGLTLSIAELTKFRLKRIHEKFRNDLPMFTGDLGFRVSSLPKVTLALVTEQK